MRRAVGEESNLHRVVILIAKSFPRSPPPRQGGVSAKISPSYIFVNLKPLRLLLGKDSNLHRVVSPLRVFHDLRHRDKEVCLPKISPPNKIFLERTVSNWSFACYKSNRPIVSLQIFQRNNFIFSFILIKLVY